MNTKVRFAGTLMVLATMLVTASAIAENTVKIGISAEPYPPFTFLAADGKWTGFEIGLQKAICKHAGVQCAVAPTAWAGIIPALQTGKIDAIMNSMTITPTREKIIDFTHPYYTTHLEWVAPASERLEIPQSFIGKLVGVQGGTQMAIYAHKKLVPMGVDIKLYAKQDQLSRDLLAGRVDAMVADSVYTHKFVKRNPSMAEKGAADWVEQQKGIALRKDEQSLEKKLNEGIDAVLRDGTCKRLSDKFLGYDVCAHP